MSKLIYMTALMVALAGSVALADDDGDDGAAGNACINGPVAVVTDAGVVYDATAAKTDAAPAVDCTKVQAIGDDEADDSDGDDD